MSNSKINNALERRLLRNIAVATAIHEYVNNNYAYYLSTYYCLPLINVVPFIREIYNGQVVNDNGLLVDEHVDVDHMLCFSFKFLEHIDDSNIDLRVRPGTLVKEVVDILEHKFKYTIREYSSDCVQILL